MTSIIRIEAVELVHKQENKNNKVVAVYPQEAPTFHFTNISTLAEKHHFRVTRSQEKKKEKDGRLVTLYPGRYPHVLTNLDLLDWSVQNVSRCFQRGLKWRANLPSG